MAVLSLLKWSTTEACLKRQITTLTQTHRSELVRSTSPQDRIYGFMPMGNVSRTSIIYRSVRVYAKSLFTEFNLL
ncbi:hypothetical protein E5288_WYG012480 [Bos mutus]|uniref:Uncharacterized protein n=1 Tax=Bos mutus TaxID=72004 RepID=A0A6B0QVT6_9CETA|nr:hypothetical protein [Bos mutus]